MTAWTSDELSHIGTAAELEIATRRHDGTLRRPLTIWVVRHGDNLYVRSVNGPEAGWFRRTRLTMQGHVWAGGIDKDVTFLDANHDLDDALDAVYRDKYRRSSARAVDAITSPEARSTTLELVPQ
jgi:hypothetical protein